MLSGVEGRFLVGAVCRRTVVPGLLVLVCPRLSGSAVKASDSSRTAAARVSRVLTRV